MDKELKKALADMTEGADPVRVETAVRERIGRGERTAGRTVRIRPVRAVLAAGIAAVLAVSVYAAVQKILTVILPVEGPYDVVLQIPEDAGDMVILPAEKREELQAYMITQEDIENGTILDKQKQFHSWAEAASWLDCGLLTSDILTEVENDAGGNVRLRVNGEIYPELGRSTSLSLYSTVTGSLLEKHGRMNGSAFWNVTIPLSGDWEQYGHTMIYLTDRVYDKGEAANVDVSEHEKQSEGELVTQYISPTGITAEIAVVRLPYSQTVYPDGITPETEMRESTEVHIYILHEGILYMMQFSAEDPQSGVETAQTIIDSLH